MQEHEFDRLGGTRSIKLNVRIIGATNRDLEALVVEGKFRQDLLYRLKVMPISTPALRQRREDIPVLAQHFITRYAAEIGRPMANISAGAARKLQGYDWPGHVRELQNVIQRAIIVSGYSQTLYPEHLPNLTPIGLRAPEAVSQSLDQLRAQERDQLKKWLLETGGDCKAVAKLFGPSIPTVYRRIREHGLSHLLKRPRR